MRPTTTRVDCCVIGGGPSGLLLCLLLARRGRSVLVLERKHAHEPPGTGPGPLIRPLTMAILDRVGVLDGLAGAQRIEAVEEYGAAGLASTETFSDSEFDSALSAPIGTLKHALLTAIEAEPAAVIRMGAQVDELIVHAGPRYTVSATVDGAPVEIDPAFLVACDGKFSTVRRMAGIHAEVFEFGRRFLRLSVPRPAGWPSVLQVHHYAHGQVVLTPAQDGSLTVLASVDVAEVSRLRQDGIEALGAHLASAVPILAEPLRQTVSDWNQVGEIPQHLVKVEHWHRGNLMLLGDSAHGMHPLGGQGMNVSLQDAVLVADLLDSLIAGDPAANAHNHELIRRPHIDRFQEFQRNESSLSESPDEKDRTRGMERAALSLAAAAENDIRPICLRLAAGFGRVAAADRT